MSTFLSIYNNRIHELARMKVSDPERSDVYQEQMDAYMLECIPFLQEEEKLQRIGTKKKEGVFSTQSTRTENIKRYMEDVEGRSFPCEVLRSGFALGTCPSCDSDEIVVKSDCYTCKICGRTEDFVGENQTYKEEQARDWKSDYPYSRENHFREWVNQFQGRESTCIPEDILTQIRYEFKKMRVTKLEDITQEGVRRILKKLKLNKYYEHAPFITAHITGVPPPQIEEDMEDQLIQMFKVIQAPFQANKPSSRKNFLSYSYVLYKFFELMGHDEFLPFLQLLKSQEKLRQCDNIWKLMCRDLEWEFIPTL